MRSRPRSPLSFRMIPIVMSALDLYRRFPRQSTFANRVAVAGQSSQVLEGGIGIGRIALGLSACAAPASRRSAHACRAAWLSFIDSTAWSNRNTAPAFDADRDVGRFHLSPLRALEPGARRRRARHAVIATAGGIVSDPEPMRCCCAAATRYGLARARRAHEPGDGAGRFPANGQEPRSDGRLVAILDAREQDYARAQARLDTSGATVEQSLAKLNKIVSPWLKR